MVDVGFILDSSGSLKDYYDKEKDFLKSLAATFGVNANGSRAGVVTFSYNAEQSIKLNDYNDLSSFSGAVDNIALMGWRTRIDKALQVAQKSMFSLNNGGRVGVPKLLILLTDGTQTLDDDAVDPGIVADELRKEGIRIISVGIGNEVNTTELAHISGDINNVYSANSFDELVDAEFIRNVKQQGCDQGNFFLYVWFFFD